MTLKNILLIIQCVIIGRFLSMEYFAGQTNNCDCRVTYSRNATTKNGFFCRPSGIFVPWNDTVCAIINDYPADVTDDYPYAHVNVDHACTSSTSMPFRFVIHLEAPQDGRMKKVMLATPFPRHRLLSNDFVLTLKCETSETYNWENVTDVWEEPSGVGFSQRCNSTVDASSLKTATEKPFTVSTLHFSAGAIFQEGLIRFHVTGGTFILLINFPMNGSHLLMRTTTYDAGNGCVIRSLICWLPLKSISGTGFGTKFTIMKDNKIVLEECKYGNFISRKINDIGSESGNYTCLVDVVFESCPPKNLQESIYAELEVPAIADCDRGDEEPQHGSALLGTMVLTITITVMILLAVMMIILYRQERRLQKSKSEQNSATIAGDNRADIVDKTSRLRKTGGSSTQSKSFSPEGSKTKTGKTTSSSGTSTHSRTAKIHRLRKNRKRRPKKRTYV